MSIKQSSNYSLIKERIRYFFTSRYRNGHGVHSPKVYEFVRKVLFNKELFSDYNKIEKLVRDLKSDSTEIDFVEMGGGSRFFTNEKRTIKDIASNSAVSKKYGRLLYRIVDYYKPDIVLELGTSIGISTLYIAMGKEKTIVHTLEGNPSVVEKAIENAEKLGVKNILFHTGDFDKILSDLLNTIETPKLAFVDGNHTYEATIQYYHQLRSKMHEGIIIFDDIYWSAGMQKAWEEIVKSEEVAIDIFQFGLIMIGDRLTPGYYKVRF